MKSTKRILSAILSVVMILGCLTVGFTAQASASDLVEAVANGGKVDWTGGNVTLADTLVINKDVEIDFNGAVITGPAGKVAIRVDGGEVTLYDGVVLADQGSYSGETGFVKALMNYKPAISINNGNVELNCITAVGSLLRIPNSGTIEVPIGNGINANDGTVVLDNVIAIGMKALDNTKADVTVKDAILAGIYKAVNIYSAVDFGANYEQYETVELLEGFLKDGVNLSANEKKYIASATNSQGDFSVGSVIVNVEKPEFTQPATTFVNGTLNVIADVEPFEHEGVSNRYSYSYTPDYAVIGEDEQAFTADGAQYVASFAGLTEGEEYDVTVNYDLSIKLGKKQKEIVEKAFSILEHYIDKAPELLNRFVKDFEDLYVKAENLVNVAFNAIVKDELVSGSAYDELVAIIYALEGMEYNGSENDKKDDLALINGGPYGNVAPMYNGGYLTGMAGYDYSRIESEVRSAVAAVMDSMTKNYGAIFDTNGDGDADALFAYTNDNTFEEKPGVTYANTEFGKGTPGYGSGKGLLDEFDDYYKAIKSRIYNVDEAYNITNDKEFKNLGDAAYFVGENWEGLLKLVENAVVVLDKAYDIVNGDSFKTLLDKLNMGGFASYVSAFNTAYKYLDKVMGRVDEFKSTSFFNKFIAEPATAAKYCKTYTEKVWKIANNPETYFDIDVNGDYVVVDLADKALNATFTVSTEAKPVNVIVNVAGLGAAKLNDFDPATSYKKSFAYGEDIVIEPVQTVEGSAFKYMVVESSDNKNIVDGGVFTAKAATNLVINLIFEAEGQLSEDKEIVFMTDKALNYKYLAGFELATDEIAASWAVAVEQEAVFAPDFKGLTKTGWSLNKDGANAVVDVADAQLAKAVAEEAAKSDVVVVYANYTYDEQVEVKPQDEAIKMTSTGSEGGKAYFELTIQLPENSGAIEAGVIATLSAEYAKDLNVGLSGTSGVVFGRTSKVDADGYVMQNVLYTYGVKAPVGRTVYGRGYVVYENGNVEYTDVFEVVVKA